MQKPSEVNAGKDFLCIRVNPLSQPQPLNGSPLPPPHLPPNTGKEGKRWRQKEEHFQTADKAGRKKTHREKKRARGNFDVCTIGKNEKRVVGAACSLLAVLVA